MWPLEFRISRRFMIIRAKPTESTPIAASVTIRFFIGFILFGDNCKSSGGKLSKYGQVLSMQNYENQNSAK
jgi:hypothetical protein